MTSMFSGVLSTFSESRVLSVTLSRTPSSTEFLKDFFQNCTGMIGLFIFMVSYCWLLLEAIVFDETMTAGIVLAVLGLSIFNLGLGALMTLGENLGAQLLESQRKVLYLSVFSLSFLCTMGEPTVAALVEESIVGRIYNHDSPLVWLLMHEPLPLLLALSSGVAVATVLGCARLIWKQSIKRWLVMLLLPTLLLSIACADSGRFLDAAVGLAFDCASATMGPLTSPILLSFGIGLVSLHRRRPSDQEEDPSSNLAGFGVIAFSALLPVIAVWILVLLTGKADYAVWTRHDAKKIRETLQQKGEQKPAIGQLVLQGLLRSAWCVGPSMGCLTVLHYAFTESRDLAKIMVSLTASFVGMALFSSGLDISLAHLSAKVSIALVSLHDAKHPWLVTFAVAFYSFVVGSFAAWCEPQLKALGQTVETLSRGDIQKERMVLTVVLGVGAGSSLGSCVLLSGLDITSVLIVGYGFCLVLTLLADEVTTAIAWDVASLSNGPVTAAVSNGLILQKQPDGYSFGILSCCSLGAMLAVLVRGMLLSPGARGRARTLTWTEMRSMPPDSPADFVR